MSESELDSIGITIQDPQRKLMVVIFHVCYTRKREGEREGGKGRGRGNMF